MLGILFGTICFVLLLRVLFGRRRFFGWRGHGHWHHSHHRSRRFFLRRLFHRLDTGPGQEKLMMQEAQTLRDTVGQLREEWSGVRSDLANVIREEHFDRSKVDALFRRQEEVFNRLRTAMADSAERVHATLDPQQKQTLASWVEQGPRFARGYGCHHVA